MSNLQYIDAHLELTDLARELLIEIRGELRYYRASVYKDESSIKINDKLNEVHFLLTILNDEMSLEAYYDYEATKERAHLDYIPGECPFSARVTNFVTNLDLALDEIQGRLAKSSNEPESQHIITGLRKHKKQILKMCQKTRKQWPIIQKI